jgi:hypothetical protein
VAAAALLERAGHPAATQYFLLAGKNADSGRHVRRVVLTAAVTPDGRVDELRALYEELESFFRGAPSGHLGQVGSLKLGRERGQALTAQRMNQRGRSALAADLATLASRLGRDADARRWLTRIDLERPELLPNPLNLVLVQARVGDHAAALTTLERLGAAKRAMVTLDLGTLERLAQRIVRSQGFLDAARLAPPEKQVMFRALGHLELGQFLLAARELRPIYLAAPERQDVAQLYAQALFSARLEAEAGRVVGRALGPQQASAVMASLRTNLSPVERSQPPAPDSDAWWRGE